MFSFIIPAYNVEKYLRECVESITSQTERNLEIIIVNDGSRDNTLRVAEQLASEDERITVISQENGGASCARNVGLDAATGNWIVFIDGDDLWASTHELAFLKKLIDKYNPDFLEFNCSYFYQSNNKIKPWVKLPFNEGEILSGADSIENLVRTGTFPMCPGLKIINREFLYRHDIRFIQGITGEDIPWFVQLLKCARKVLFTNRYVYLYRKDVMGSVSSTFSQKSITDLLTITETGISNTPHTNKALMSFWAYELSIIMGMMTYLDKKEFSVIYKRIYSYRWIFSYTLNPKVSLVAKAIKICGFRLTTIFLGLIIRKKISSK